MLLVGAAPLASKRSLPLDEEQQLGSSIVSFLKLVEKKDYKPEADPSGIQQFKHLEARVIDVLGLAHWTAAAAMKIRALTDPMIHPFSVMAWGESYLKWMELAAPGDVQTIAREQWRHAKGLLTTGRAPYFVDRCLPVLMALHGQDGVQEILSAQALPRRSTCFNYVCPRQMIRVPFSAQLCSGCSVAEYCSSECQKQDWPIHKHVCKQAGAGILALRSCMRNHTN